MRRVGVTFAHAERESLGIGRHTLRQRVLDPGDHDEPAVLLRQHPGTGQQFQHAAEQACVFGFDLQLPTELVGVDRRAGRPLPTKLVEGRKRIARGHPLLVRYQRGPVAGRDPLLRQEVGEQARIRRDA